MTSSLVSDVILGPCKGCGRQRVDQKAYARKPQHWREHGFVRSNAFELCTGCYSRARRVGTLPEPAPSEPQPRRPRRGAHTFRSVRMTAPTANRAAITYDQLYKIAENLRQRHKLGTPLEMLPIADQDEWVDIARNLLRGTGIQVRG